ncbi:hypothetical protein ACFYWP_39035 [Actinacidiphila glaucinigra]|uniref:hypothetical protein n=1 Tax=Actinacidiphila glaucinigra TaxID=235986 RepID=UPI00368EF9A3
MWALPRERGTSTPDGGGTRAPRAATARPGLLVLAMLRCDERLLDLAGGNGVPESTLRRWRNGMIDLLAARLCVWTGHFAR